jgi:AI-2 transport protein TqsA
MVRCSVCGTVFRRRHRDSTLNSILGAVGGILAGFSGLPSVVVLVLALLLFFIADAATFDKRLDGIAADRPHVVGALESFARGTRIYLFVIQS